MRTWRESARPLGWGVADQAVSSATNFALAVVVARSVDLDEFGRFALVFAGYVFFLGVGRAAVGDPLLARYSTAGPDGWHEGARAAVGAMLVLASSLSLLLLGASFVAGSGASEFRALAATLPFLLVQDAFRYAFFAKGTGRSAFVNDLVWAVTFVPLLVLVVRDEAAPVSLFVLAWGGAAAVATAVGFGQARLLPEPGAARGWWRAHRDLSARYTVDFVGWVGVLQLTLLVIGAVAGLAALGAIRASEVLLGPLTVLFSGVSVVAISEGARLVRRSPEELIRFSAVVSTCLVTTVVLWTATLLAAPAVSDALLGQASDAARTVLVPVAVMVAGTGALLGPLLALRAVAAARRTLRARLATAPLTLVSGSAGAALGGARGAAYAIAAANWISVVVWWWQLRLAVQDRENEVGPRNGARLVTSRGRHDACPTDIGAKRPRAAGRVRRGFR